MKYLESEPNRPIEPPGCGVGQEGDSRERLRKSGNLFEMDGVGDTSGGGGNQKDGLPNLANTVGKGKGNGEAATGSRSRGECGNSTFDDCEDSAEEAGRFEFTGAGQGIEASDQTRLASGQVEEVPGEIKFQDALEQMLELQGIKVWEVSKRRRMVQVTEFFRAMSSVKGEGRVQKFIRMVGPRLDLKLWKREELQFIEEDGLTNQTELMDLENVPEVLLALVDRGKFKGEKKLAEWVQREAAEWLAADEPWYEGEVRLVAARKAERIKKRRAAASATGETQVIDPSGRKGTGGEKAKVETVADKKLREEIERSAVAIVERRGLRIEVDRGGKAWVEWQGLEQLISGGTMRVENVRDLVLDYLKLNWEERNNQKWMPAERLPGYLAVLGRMKRLLVPVNDQQTVKRMGDDLGYPEVMRYSQMKEEMELRGLAGVSPEMYREYKRWLEWELGSGHEANIREIHRQLVVEGVADATQEREWREYVQKLTQMLQRSGYGYLLVEIDLMREAEIAWEARQAGLGSNGGFGSSQVGE